MLFILIKFIVGSIILGIGAYTDLKTRKASNKLWLVLGSIAITLLIIEFLERIDYIKIILIPGLILIFYVLFQFNIIQGGADAKAMMCLSILIPFNVFDVFILSANIMFLSIPFIYFNKKIPMKEVLFKYQYPVLVTLFIGFILSFFLSGFWDEVLIQKIMMYLYS